MVVRVINILQGGLPNEAGTSLEEKNIFLEAKKMKLLEELQKIAEAIEESILIKDSVSRDLIALRSLA